MALIEPVSSLSIKKSVNMYTIILFLSFGILLYWLALDRYQVFVDAHEDVADNTTRIVAYQVSKTIQEKQRIIDVFVERYKDMINRLAEQPDDESLHRLLSARLKKYQPDFLSFSILNSAGEPLITDFDGYIGELCTDDIKHYIENRQQRLRLHPNHNGYHYDIISKYSKDKAGQLFFVSFDASELSSVLNSTQPAKHNLLLVNKGAGNLIEVTVNGDRSTMVNRFNYKMQGNENIRVLSTTKVNGTDWSVVDMREDGLFDNYRKGITTEYLVAFYIFSIIAMFMRHILLRQDERRAAAERRLKENHAKIKELNDQLELLSRTDSLTGLFNRRYFDEKVHQEWNRGLRSGNALSCILIDIDYFKNFNDLYGHQAGDKCLKDLSLVMKDTFRRAGDLVARYGGEEFIIIMADTSEEDAKKAIEQFQSELKKLNIPHRDSSVNDRVTASAGLTNMVPTRDITIETFIGRADKALYTAKENGRNQWVIFGSDVD